MCRTKMTKGGLIENREYAIIWIVYNVVSKVRKEYDTLEQAVITEEKDNQL